MARLRFFASLREKAGVSEIQIDAETVQGLLEEACRRFGPAFSAQVGRAAVVWNGNEVGQEDLAGVSLQLDDEVALLPPVSGGS